MQTSGDQRREKAKVCQPSLRAKRSNPSLLSPRYGLLRFARNDVERVVSHRQHDRVRSPDERSDIRGSLFHRPGYRFAHPGYKHRSCSVVVTREGAPAEMSQPGFGGFSFKKRARSSCTD